MLEEIGTVVEVKDGFLLVETQSRSSCSHCSSSGCSTSVISKLFGVRRNLLQLENTLDASPGDQVTIGIPDRLLVRASVWGYLLPLLVMIAAGVSGSLLGLNEESQSLLALGGLAFGFILVRWATTRNVRSQQGFTPQLLRINRRGLILVDTPNPVRS